MALSAQRIEELRKKYPQLGGMSFSEQETVEETPVSSTELLDGLRAGKYRAPVETEEVVEEKEKFDILDNPVTRGIQAVFPGKKIGESLGTIAAAGGRAIQGDMKGAGEILDTQVPVPELIGDVVAGGATALSAGLAAPAGLAGKVAQGAGLGATISGGRAVSEGDEIGEVAKDAAVGGAIGGAIPLVGEAVKGFGRLLRGTGDKIQFSVIKPTQADIKDGFSLDTVKKYDLGGSLTESFGKTETALDDLTAQLNSKIEAGSPLNLQKVLQETASELTEKKTSSFGSNTSVAKALDQLKGEVDTIVDKQGLVPLTDAQTVKRAAGHMGAWQFGQRDPDSSARERVYNVFYTKMKEAIEKSSPEGVKEINKQISELIPVMNALIRRIPVAERSNVLGLGEIISLAGATVNPAALGVGLLNIGSKSGWVGDKLSKAGQSIMGGIPVAGNALRTLAPQGVGGDEEIQD